MQEKYDPSSIKRIADSACSYARSYILLSNTDLQLNKCTPIYYTCACDAIHDIRELCDGEEREEYCHFYHMIEVLQKYSIGNCEELAVMAFYYVMHNTSNLAAELIGVFNGDHAFLLLNRKKKSIITKPPTWGKHAYICDPLLNAVFPARDYLSQCKTFKIKTLYNKKSQQHKTYNIMSGFDPALHSFVKFTNYSMERLRRADQQDQDAMQDLFNTRNAILIREIKPILRKLKQVKLQSQSRKQNGKNSKLASLIQQIRRELITLMAPLEVDLTCKIETYYYPQMRKASVENALRERFQKYHGIVSKYSRSSAVTCFNFFTVNKGKNRVCTLLREAEKNIGRVHLQLFNAKMG